MLFKGVDTSLSLSSNVFEDFPCSRWLPPIARQTGSNLGPLWENSQICGRVEDGIESCVAQTSLKSTEAT